MFQKRGASRTMPKNGKIEVVKKIMECLKSNLESQNIVSELVDVTIINKINGLIEEAELWGKARTKLIKDVSTIAEKVAKHSLEFDISGHSPKSRASKRKFETVNVMDSYSDEVLMNLINFVRSNFLIRGS